MQKVPAGLNPEDGPDFVTVYINDILVFSRTLEDHLEHLWVVFEWLQETQPKLKPVHPQGSQVFGIRADSSGAEGKHKAGGSSH